VYTVHVNVTTDYPVLPTRFDWTQNSSLYCNSCTAEHPNTNIFDSKRTI